MFAALSQRLQRIFRWRSRRSPTEAESAPLGIYGSPNAGKSSLANVICEDWGGHSLSRVSHLAHETRKIQRKERLVIRQGDEELTVDVVDTPGLATRVDPFELEVFHDMSPADAEARARSATAGILEAIDALRTMEGMLLVIDSCQDPYQQVNEVLLAHVRARRIPVIVIANKTDRPDSRPDLVTKAFGPHFPVVCLSARERTGIEDLYSLMFRTFG